MMIRKKGLGRGREREGLGKLIKMNGEGKEEDKGGR